MKIFLAATSLLPAYGGPAISVSRLAVALGEAGAEVGLWAADQSAIGALPLEARATVQCLSGNVEEALKRFGGADVLHDNGIWLPHNHRLAKLAARHAIPRIVSTRGMLEPWAVAHKRWKKYAAWHLYQHGDLANVHCLHATSEAEAANLLRFAPGVPVKVIANGVDVPEIADRAAAPQSTRTVLFVGRLYPVKGLPALIEAWARVRPPSWSLRIAGPDEAGHRSQLERAVAAAGLGEVISFLGPVYGERKRAEFMNADIFALPSHSESFGMAVAEALAHGLPVLTTKAVPWPVLSARRCGWQVAPTVESIAEGLREATSLDRQTLHEMGARGRAFVAGELDWGKIASEFLALYANICARDTPALQRIG